VQSTHRGCVSSLLLSSLFHTVYIFFQASYIEYIFSACPCFIQDLFASVSSSASLRSDSSSVVRRLRRPVIGNILQWICPSASAVPHLLPADRHSTLRECDPCEWKHESHHQTVASPQTRAKFKLNGPSLSSKFLAVSTVCCHEQVFRYYYLARNHVQG
jgi:hypothetical protein